MQALGADDDFFYLGGDSLSGLEVIERIHSDFGVDLPPMAMYDRANTLAKMTALIDAELSRSQEEH
jgi:acyl carrier protein